MEVSARIRKVGSSGESSLYIPHKIASAPSSISPGLRSGVEPVHPCLLGNSYVWGRNMGQQSDRLGTEFGSVHISEFSYGKRNDYWMMLIIGRMLKLISKVWLRNL